MLPGGSGKSPTIVAQIGGPGALSFPAASRVSISELFGSRLCLDNMSVLTYTPGT
jgi:hypothetical protein